VLDHLITFTGKKLDMMLSDSLKVTVTFAVSGEPRVQLTFQVH